MLPTRCGAGRGLSSATSPSPLPGRTFIPLVIVVLGDVVYDIGHHLDAAMRMTINHTRREPILHQQQEGINHYTRLPGHQQTHLMSFGHIAAGAYISRIQNG